MTPAELAEQCVEQINLAGNESIVMLTMKGKCNKSGTKRFAPGGPIGRINGEDMTDEHRVVVTFKAVEVLAFLAARGLVKAVGPDGEEVT